jgi:hypothetical protein
MNIIHARKISTGNLIPADFLFLLRSRWNNT